MRPQPPFAEAGWIHLCIFCSLPSDGEAVKPASSWRLAGANAGLPGAQLLWGIPKQQVGAGGAATPHGHWQELPRASGSTMLVALAAETWAPGPR